MILNDRGLSPAILNLGDHDAEGVLVLSIVDSVKVLRLASSTDIKEARPARRGEVMA
jgi:hypothetical protein